MAGESFDDEILVAGVWRRGAGAALETSDPATGEVLARLHGADAGDVADAVAGAAEAAADPHWRSMPPHERARYLTAIADGIAGRAGELARLQTADTGKSINETRALVGSAEGTRRCPVRRGGRRAR